MANKKIPCGGFEIGDGLELDGVVLSASASGGDFGVLIVSVVSQTGNFFTTDKTYDEILNTGFGKAIFLKSKEGLAPFAYYDETFYFEYISIVEDTIEHALYEIPSSGENTVEYTKYRLEKANTGGLR